MKERLHQLVEVEAVVEEAEEGLEEMVLQQWTMAMAVTITGVVDTVGVGGAVVEAVVTEAAVEVAMVGDQNTSKMRGATTKKHLLLLPRAVVVAVEGGNTVVGAVMVDQMVRSMQMQVMAEHDWNDVKLCRISCL